MSHVLIIEDDVLVALDVQAWAEERGARTTAVATTEDAAVRIAAEHRPDLITSDVRLIQGSGPDAVRRILQQLGPIPVIYITGNPEAVRKSDPAARVVVKPYRWQQIDDEAEALGLEKGFTPTHVPNIRVAEMRIRADDG